MKNTVKIGLIALALAAACGGKPAVPDEQQAREYASTKNDAEAMPKMTPIENGATQAAPKASGPVATVDGRAVTADEFNLEVERGVEKGMQPALLRQFKDQIIDQLVDRTLIDGAIKGAKIAVAATEIDSKMDEVRAEFARASAAMGQESTLEDATKQMGITPDEFRKSIEQAIAIEKILVTRGFKAPDEATAQTFYEDNKTRFERPEQVRVRHVLIKVENADDQAAWDAAKKRAEMVRVEATKKDADFAALAKDKSEGPMADRGGDLGFRPRGMMPEEFDTAAFALKKGEISAPVKTSFGWHVIKLEDRHDAGIVPYAEIAEQLKAQMKNEAVNEALVGLLEELRKKAKIERHPENVD